MYMPNTGLHDTGLHEKPAKYSFGGYLEAGEPTDDWNMKYSRLLDVMDSTPDRYKQFFKDNSENSLLLFILPEYFFNSNESPHKEETLGFIIDYLKTINKIHEKMLLIGGSIPWYRREEDNTLKTYVSTPVLYNGELVFVSSKLIDVSDSTLSKESYKKFTAKNWGLAVTDKKGIIKYGNDTSTSRKERLEKLNTLRKYLNEKLDIKGDKDFFELTVDSSTLKIGIEICADHGIGRLARNPKVPELDLQIIISYGMSLQNSAITVRKGGYIVTCDGSTSKACGIYRCEANIKRNESNMIYSSLDKLSMNLMKMREKRNSLKEEIKSETDPEAKKKLKAKEGDILKAIKGKDEELRDLRKFWVLYFSDTKTRQLEVVSYSNTNDDNKRRFDEAKIFIPITLSSVQTFMENIKSLFHTIH